MKSILTAVILIVMVLGSGGAAEASADNPCKGRVNESFSIYAGEKKLGKVQLHYAGDGTIECAVVRNTSGERLKTRLQYRVYDGEEYTVSRLKSKKKAVKAWGAYKRLPGHYDDFDTYRGSIKYNGKWYFG